MENTVSQFLVSTCGMHTKFTINKDLHLIPLQKTHTLGLINTQTVCGSQAEFYIRPVYPCIDDIDILAATNYYLAFDSSYEIPEGFGDLCNAIMCPKLESYEQNPSFVLLRDPVVGIYDWNLEEYTYKNIPFMGVMERGFDMDSTLFMVLRKHMTMLSNIDGKLIDLNKVLPKCFTAIGPAINTY